MILTEAEVTPEMSQYTLSLVASFGALAGALVPFLKDWRKEHLRKPNEASKYFEDLANTLSAVVHELKKKSVPRIDGTHLNGLLQTFEEKVNPLSPAKLPSKLKGTLLGAAKAAKTLDAWALAQIQLDDKQRELLLANLERAAGTCKTLAANFREDA
jgi:hypothetical protein